MFGLTRPTLQGRAITQPQNTGLLSISCIYDFQMANREPSELPLVSVIIATRDRKNLVARAIDSALMQENSDCEIIVVDDGSEDGTSEMIRARYGNKLVLVEKREPTGDPDCRNLGFLRSSGEFIALLDDDDYWTDSRKLENQVRLMIENPAVGVSGTWWHELNGGSNLNPKQPELPMGRYRKGNRLMSSGGVTTASTAMISREAWVAAGGMHPIPVKGRDSDLWRRVFLAGFDHVVVPDFTAIIDIGHGLGRRTESNDRSGKHRQLAAHLQTLRKYGLIYLRFPHALFVRLGGVVSALVSYGRRQA